MKHLYLLIQLSPWLHLFAIALDMPVEV